MKQLKSFLSRRPLRIWLQASQWAVFSSYSNLFINYIMQYTNNICQKLNQALSQKLSENTFAAKRVLVATKMATAKNVVCLLTNMVLKQLMKKQIRQSKILCVKTKKYPIARKNY